MIEQGSELRSLPTRRATGLPLRPQAPYFDHEKISDDRREPGEQDLTRRKAISECCEDWFELRLDSSRFFELLFVKRALALKNYMALRNAIARPFSCTGS
jgi:hypothetical protein